MLLDAIDDHLGSVASAKDIFRISLQALFQEIVHHFREFELSNFRVEVILDCTLGGHGGRIVAIFC